MVRPPIVAVCGATGHQGGSVVNHLLLTDQWKNHIRGLTRDLEQPHAQALQQKGVDMVKADLTDRDSLVKAFTNVDTLFLVTNYYDKSTKECSEYDQAINAAEVAKQCGVENIIFSTLVNMEKLTGGKYKVPHFTLKSKAADEIARMGFTNAVFVMPGFYYQNMHQFYKPHRAPDGSIVFSLPCKPETIVPGLDIRDIGAVVAKIVNEPHSFKNDVIPVAAEYISFRQMADELTKALGIPTVIREVSDEEAKSLGIMDELVEMMHAFETVGYYGDNYRNFDVAHSLYPDLKTWHDYLSTINPEYVFEKVILEERA